MVHKFAFDYLIEAGYKQIGAPPGEVFDSRRLWQSPKGGQLTYKEARAEAFGSCECCGQPAAYPGALRCGAACSAMHEGKDCLHYKPKPPAKLDLVKG
jgi:hypothetical protein